MKTAGFPTRPVLRAGSAPAPVAGRHPRLHLTRRGRVVLAILGALPLLGIAFADSMSGERASASRAGTIDMTFEYITVERGESLWEIAEELAPASDPREVIADIVELNRLDSADVFAGQEISLPVAYVQ